MSKIALKVNISTPAWTLVPAKHWTGLITAPAPAAHTGGLAPAPGAPLRPGAVHGDFGSGQMCTVTIQTNVLSYSPVPQTEL